MHPKPETRNPKPVSRLARVVLLYTVTVLAALAPLSYGVTEINEDWVLDSDYTGSLSIKGISGDFHPKIDLNGYRLTLSSEGIEVSPSTHTIMHGGTLTSSGSFLAFRLMSQKEGNSYISIDSVITDSDQSVGLRITGNNLGDGAVFLQGNLSNTFTGNVEVSGSRNHLVLNKSDGAIALRGDILARDGAILRFSNSSQLLKTSNVTLKGNGVLQNFANSDIQNEFNKLTIDDKGIVEFNHNKGNPENPKYYIKVDDIIIHKGGLLEVIGWKDTRDFLLVRKDSTTLDDTLTKIGFNGYDRRNIHLEEFDAEYWSISAAPESATYGAIFASLGVAIRYWQRRRRG